MKRTLAILLLCFGGTMLFAQARGPSGLTAEELERRGSAYREKGDYDKAIADYTEAIKLEPRNADYYIVRGASYYETDDYDRAIADYTEAMNLGVGDETFMTYFLRGNAYFAKGDYDKTIADLTEAIKLEPKEDHLYVLRGHAYFEKRDYDKTLADYEAALRINPNRSDNNALRGLISRLRGMRGN